MNSVNLKKDCAKPINPSKLFVSEFSALLIRKKRQREWLAKMQEKFSNIEIIGGYIIPMLEVELDRKARQN